MGINCPKCDGVITKENFNVAKDIAYCDRCDENFSYSDLLEDQEMESVDLSVMPKGIRFEQVGRGDVLVYKKIPPVVLFLIPFTAIWSGMSMTGMVAMIMQKGFRLETLFFLPFFIGTLVLIYSILFCIFGKVRIYEEFGNVKVFTGFAGLGRTKSFNTQSFIRASEGVANYRQNNRLVYCIEVESRDKNIKFGSGMTEQARQFVIAYLNKRYR